MSFDLYLRDPDSDTPSAERLKEYFAASLLFRINDLENGGAQFWYENQATGVYCDFSYCPRDSDEEVAGRSGTRLSFSLNYNRPSFFAYETMPLVQDFCEHFGLLVEDVQEETVGAADSSQLIGSWRKHNAWAVSALSEQEAMSLLYLPERTATQWWRYSRVRERIESSLSEDIFVPEMLILQSPQRRLFTMIVWPKGIAQFFPICDYVLIQREQKRFFRLKTDEEIGLVSYERVVDSLRSYLKEYDGPEGSIEYLSPREAGDVASVVQAYNLVPIELSSHSRVAPDGFIDVEDVKRTSAPERHS